MSSMAVRRVSSFAAFALAMAVAGCNCSGPGTHIAHCTSDADCSKDGTRFCDTHASPLDGDDPNGCHDSSFVCTNEGQCCPGQICASSAGVCFDKWVACDDDSTCTAKGQVCKPAYDGADKGCTFDKCDATGGCADGLNCFNGYCVGEPPCNGGCNAGSVCTPVNNRCFQIDDPTTPYPQTCQQTCKPGTILVFKDGYNVFNKCDRHDRDCECQALPPVKSNDMARYSSAAVTGDEILVSAYDTDHGDLVFHEFDKATLKLKRTTWLDGVPTSGAVVGDPAGPRGGRVAPGPDVGEYTSIAFDSVSNNIHIAYYAVKDGTTPLGNLKYAVRSGTGDWKIHTVDGQTDSGQDTGDVGMYASIALSSDGFPIIAYFQKGGTGNDAYKTAVKVARAKVKTPASASDWTISTVDTGARTPPPCSNPACGTDEVCTASDTNPNGVCRKKSAHPTTDCNPNCSSSQACAQNPAGSFACFDSLRASTLAALPEGNGLFPSVAYFDDKPVVVWYDHADGQLKGVVAASDSATAGAQFQASDIKVLDDGTTPNAPAAALPHDVGQFASLAIGPSDAGKRIAVGYFDATARQLRVIQAGPAFADVTPVASRVVDDGTGSNPEEDATLFVGADANVRFDASKNVEVVYQDSTSNDLRLAVQQAGGASYKVTTLAHDGAGGFYPNLLIDGADRYATHAIIKAKSASQSANKLDVLKIQVQ